MYRFVFQGPEESLYREGYFILEIEFPDEYPFKAFKAKFLTPIYHPTVNMEGKFCTCCFTEEWSLDRRLFHFFKDLF